MTTANLTKVIVPCRLSYAHLWEPDSINGSEPKYSVSCIIDKNDKETIAKIKKAIEVAKDEGKGKWGGKIPANLKTPLRDGDIDRPEDEAYADSMFLNANSKQAPQIVDRQVQPILDQSEVYSGCYGRVSITFYAYKRIACKKKTPFYKKSGAPCLRCVAVICQDCRISEGIKTPSFRF